MLAVTKGFPEEGAEAVPKLANGCALVLGSFAAFYYSRPPCFSCGRRWAGDHWLHIRKDGGPDLRYKPNYRVCNACGQMSLKGQKNGLGCLGCLGLIAALTVFGSIAKVVVPTHEETRAEPNGSPRVPADSEEKPKPDPPKPDLSEPRKEPDGFLVLRSSVPIIQGVNAWVEIDGVRRADWKVGTTQVQLSLPAGTYRVAVYSIYRNKKSTIYDGQATVREDTLSTVKVGP